MHAFAWLFAEGENDFYASQHSSISASGFAGLAYHRQQGGEPDSQRPLQIKVT
jgi:hypothetical protein